MVRTSHEEAKLSLIASRFVAEVHESVSQDDDLSQGLHERDLVTWAIELHDRTMNIRKAMGNMEVAIHSSIGAVKGYIGN